jgi:xanthine dehydrogenase accessory factor
VKADVLAALQDARRAKRPVVLLTHLPGGAQQLVEAGDDVGPALIEAVREALRSDAAKTIDTDEGRVFVEPFNPSLRLVIVGAVHIAQPLVRLAEVSNLAAVIVDPRTAFASEARFAGVERLTGWPDEELEGLDLDTRTAVVTLTHDPKLDDPALEAALRSPAFYIGALGSRKTHAARVERLSAAGWDTDAVARIHAPVGLNIRARTPAEIAVSIIAQIVEVLRR